MKVLISGCGTLGCELALYLIQHPQKYAEVHTVDFDHFCQRNSINQLFTDGPKSQVLADFLSPQYSTKSYQNYVQQINISIYDIIFSTTDSIQARIYVAKNSKFSIDFGVSMRQFSVRFYGKEFGQFVNVFDSKSNLKCSVEQINTAEDIVQLCALDGGEFNEIYIKSKQLGALYSFGHQITEEFVRTVLRMEKQPPAIISKCCVSCGMRKLSQQQNNFKIDDLTMGSFIGGYKETVCNFKSETNSERCVIYQGRIVYCPWLQIEGDPYEIENGIIYNI
ncbi:ThiF family protein [Spironucleus salmonicida]|uniref:ThiF family protein n=1 Tax=Spironucleus salmonicida TaxID=348837 RepID=V6LMT6_9EUKA|nr:ThiF family protein [Spironucleus salmonicida]|eukprot:EST45026.1 ThiF family protein [Spironucleus salmonicida]